MTIEERKQAIADMRKLKAEYMNGKKIDAITERKCKSFDMAIKALEHEPKIDRLYSYLNDMRFGIAPDETTPTDERDKRLAQIEIIDGIMEWIEKESEE